MKYSVNMRDLDWQIIVKLYKEKNITRTADLVFMTQPTLTKHIQQIEEELGILLVTRSSKGVSFTPEGEYAAKKAEEILGLFEDVKQYLSFANGGKKGVLKIGVPNSYCRLIMPHLIKKYTEIYNDVRFDISTAHSHEVLKMVEDREVNIGFVRGDFISNLEQILVSTDQTYVVSKGSIELSDLPHIPQIDFAKEPTILRATDRWWKERFDTPPMILMRVNHADICRAMILAGLGYGIFPDIGYTNEADKLIAIPLVYKNGKELTRNTKLVYHKEDAKNPLINTFIQFIQDMGVKSFKSA
jgi:DNA-binding transcriptional LysR family regulator